MGVRLKRTCLGGAAAAGRSCQGRAGSAGWCRCGDEGVAGAGLEAGGGDVVLPVTHLEPEVAEAALQDFVGAVVEGQEGRHVGAAADPDTFRGPQLLGQVLWQLLVSSGVEPGQRMIF
jgi:hypothetical protein